MAGRMSNNPIAAPRLRNRASASASSSMLTEDDEIDQLLENKKNKKPPSPSLPPKRGLSKTQSENYRNFPGRPPPPIPPKSRSFIDKFAEYPPAQNSQAEDTSSEISKDSSLYDSDSEMDTDSYDDYITVLADVRGLNFVNDSTESSSESSYARVANKHMKISSKTISDRYPLEQRFNEVLSTILLAEDNFLKQYIDIGKNSSYYKIREDSKSAAIKIFGAVTELLLFHTEMRPRLKQCTSPLELADVFIKHKEKLRLHIADQWKLCQCENPDIIVKNTAVYNSEFPTLSQKLIGTYREQMHLLIDIDENLSESDNFQYANQILKSIFKQIVFINIALKSIIDPNITLSECGEVLHFGRLHVKTHRPSLVWKMMDIFFMQKYIILTRKKKDKLYFFESIPAHDVEYKAKESDMTISIYSMHEKKKILLIKIPKEKVGEFHTIKSILQHMNDNGLNLLI